MEQSQGMWGWAPTSSLYFSTILSNLPVELGRNSVRRLRGRKLCPERARMHGSFAFQLRSKASQDLPWPSLKLP